MRRLRRSLGTACLNSLVLAGVHAGFGLSLIFQATRWTGTPAYANLFAVIPEFWWGVIYLIASALLVVGVVVRERTKFSAVLLMAINVNLALTAAWGGAFLVRYLTSPNTTPFTFGSSIVQVFVLTQAMRALHREAAVARAEAQ